MVGGVLEAIGGLARLSEGVPNAPFAGYSGADLRLAIGVERGEGGGGEGADGGVKSCSNTLGVCLLGLGTLGVRTLGVCGVSCIGVAGKK